MRSTAGRRRRYSRSLSPARKEDKDEGGVDIQSTSTFASLPFGSPGRLRRLDIGQSAVPETPKAIRYETRFITSRLTAIKNERLGELERSTLPSSAAPPIDIVYTLCTWICISLTFSD